MMTVQSHQRREGLFHGRRTRALLRFATATFVVALLCSCAVIRDPYVTPSSTGSSRSAFAAAEKYANGKADELEGKMLDLHTYEFATGSLIVMSGIVGAGIGAYGAHADALIGTGLAGGTAYGARGLVPIQDRKAIYERGASTIRCAVSALRLDRLAAAIQDTKLAANELQKAIQDTERAANELEESRNAIADAYLELYTGALQEGAAARMAAQKTEEAKEEAGRFVINANAIDEGERAERLVAVTDAILQSVTAQVNAARLDPDAAVDALLSKTQTLTSGINDAFQKLNAKLGVAKEKNEQVKKNAERSSASAQAQAVQNQPDVAENGNQQANQATVNIRKLDAVEDRALRVLKMFNLEGACGGGT